jgi:hypothetical protein
LGDHVVRRRVDWSRTAVIGSAAEERCACGTWL